MALFISDRITGASGSVGGVTYSHNRFGLYLRARRKPVNPNTTSQQAVRASLATASSAWRSLTAAQRAAWEVYAANTPMVNSLGLPVFMSGQQQFTATNSIAQRLASITIADAPTIPGRVALGVPSSVVIDASTASFTASGLSVPDGVNVGIYLSSPIPDGVTFFAGPYQAQSGVAAASGTVTDTGLTARNGVPFAAGQRIGWRLAGIDNVTTGGEGRLTTVASGIVVVTA